MSVISMRVFGTPSPKGSYRAFVSRKTRRAVLVPSSNKKHAKELKNWAQAVREGAAELTDRVVFVDVPLVVNIVFYLARPAGHFSKRHAGVVLPSAPRWPGVRPDIDKLARSTLDALTEVVFDDDARIVKLSMSKEYVGSAAEAGARIEVWPA